jgi:membrane protein implicated in regulation of membrane protease activity
MDSLFIWWDALPIFRQVLFCVTIPATLILLIQTILLLIGIGGDHGDIGDTTGDLGDIGDAGDIGDMSDIGADVSGDLPADIGNAAHAGHTMSDFGLASLFTLQGVVTFFTVFGWSSLVMDTAGWPIPLTLFLGLNFGVLAMVGVAKIIHLSAKLAQNGTLDSRKLLGESGTVYITIPADGRGKVMIQSDERYVECEAVTEDGKELKSGHDIRVVDIVGGVLVVSQEK